MIEQLRRALERIAAWEMPSTDQFWDEEKTRPMSYAAAYGSRGEQDVIRNIAMRALSIPVPDMPVAEELEAAVKQALLDGQPAAVIVTPLVNMLARLTVGVHKKTGVDFDGLVEIIRNQLDEAVVHYREA